MKDLHIWMTQQNPDVGGGNDDDDGHSDNVKDAHNDGEGSGNSKD